MLRIESDLGEPAVEMIEPEVAFCDLRGDMALAEEFLRFVLRAVLDEAAEDMAFFDQRIAPGVRATLEHVAGAEFAHLTYTEAIAALKASGRTFEFPVSWGVALQAEHERYLCEEYTQRPVIVTDYPKEIKAFYMRLNDDGRTVAAMDVLAPGIGAELDWYRDLRRYGTVPHAGFGLGLERLVLYMTGMDNIRDAIPFPRFPKHAAF